MLQRRVTSKEQSISHLERHFDAAPDKFLVSSL